MANHFSHRSLPYPIRGAKFTFSVPFANPYDETPSFDTKVSKDGGAIADATEEVTQITGINAGYITLTATEMTAAMVIVVCNCISGQAPTIFEFAPRNLQSIVTGTASAGAAGTITLAASAAGYENAIVITTGGTGSGQARMIKSVSGNVCTVAENWETNPDATTTYAILRTEFMAGSSGSTPPTVGEIADAVCDELLSGHTTAGSLGKVLADAATASALATVAAYIDTEVAAILAAVDTEVATIVTATSAASIRTAIGLSSANLDSQLGGLSTGISNVSGFVDDIGIAGAGLTAVPWNAAWAAQVRAAVGLASANMDTQLSAIVGDTNELQTDWTNGGRLDLLLDQVVSTLGSVANDTDLIATIPTANQNADALLDRASAIAGKTPRQALTIIGAMVGGTTQDAGTASEKFKDFSGSLCVTVTVTPAGERTAVAYS